MSKVFQIVNGATHWQVNESLESIQSKMPPDCIFVEAPDYVTEGWGYDDTKEGDERFVQPTPPEGFIYDVNTGTFYPESEEGHLLLIDQNGKQAENKMKLADYLENHPITWTDDKKYGITMEDQSEISLNIAQYNLQLQAGVENPVLEWHAIHEACVPWTLEDLTALVIAITNAVYPAFNLMQEYKKQIYACADRAAVIEVNLDYSVLDPKTEEETTEEPIVDTEEAPVEDVIAEEEVPAEEAPVEEETASGGGPSASEDPSV